MLSTRCIQRGCHVKLNRDDWQALAEAKVSDYFLNTITSI
jgi:hypothetical protein